MYVAIVTDLWTEYKVLTVDGLLEPMPDCQMLNEAQVHVGQEILECLIDLRLNLGYLHTI